MYRKRTSQATVIALVLVKVYRYKELLVGKAYR